MIFTYSKELVGDVLMVIVKDSKGAKYIGRPHV